MVDTTLPSEVAEAIACIRNSLRVQGVSSHGPQFTAIREYCNRLAEENARLSRRYADAESNLAVCDGALQTMQAERDALMRENMLLRVGDKAVDAQRSQMIDSLTRQRDALKARIAEAPVVTLGLASGDEGDELLVVSAENPKDWIGKSVSVRLVVEDGERE